jgi:hypothetical protein
MSCVVPTAEAAVRHHRYLSTYIDIDAIFPPAQPKIKSGTSSKLELDG